MKDKRDIILEFYSSPDAILNALHQAGWKVVPEASPLAERIEPSDLRRWLPHDDMTHAKQTDIGQPSDQPPSPAKATDDKQGEWPLNDKPAIFNGIRFGLTVEKWIIINKAHNAELAAERQRREQAEATANHNADIGDSIARASKQTEDALRERCEQERSGRLLYMGRDKVLRSQLMSALAAIEKHNRLYSDPERHIDVDLSALREHDAEVRKPLVELLRKCRHHLPANIHGLKLEIDDALAKVKE